MPSYWNNKHFTAEYNAMTDTFQQKDVTRKQFIYCKWMKAHFLENFNIRWNPHPMLTYMYRVPNCVEFAEDKPHYFNMCALQVCNLWGTDSDYFSQEDIDDRFKCWKIDIKINLAVHKLLLAVFTHFIQSKEGREFVNLHDVYFKDRDTIRVRRYSNNYYNTVEYDHAADAVRYSMIKLP